MTEGKRNIIQGLLREYDIETADDIQDALKDLLSGALKEMMETEMDEHLGYDRYERSDEPNCRNGTKQKRVRSKYGEFEVDVPQDRQSSFEPKILPKRKKDISAIDDKKKLSGNGRFRSGTGEKSGASWRSCTQTGCRSSRNAGISMVTIHPDSIKALHSNHSSVIIKVPHKWHI